MLLLILKDVRNKNTESDACRKIYVNKKNCLNKLLTNNKLLSLFKCCGRDLG